METELKLLLVRNAEDILLVHEWALQLATCNKADSIKQIRFAAAVAESCAGNNDLQITSLISFGLKMRVDGNYFLKASNNSSLVAELEVHPETCEDNLKNLPAGYWKSRKELRRSFHDMQQFTFAISHDLKNSLTKLKLALSLVEEEEMPPVILNYIQIIHRSAVRLERTMLSLNQVIELGHSSIRVVNKISPALIFADVYDEFAESLTRLGASVTTDFTRAGELTYPSIYLKSIFSNLVSNAVKYSATGRPLQLNITAYRDNEKLRLVFTDNGQGIDLQRFGNKLFHPFTRFSSNTEGSGLGLYLIKNIVERNGGSVEVESTPGKGTCFRFLIKEYDLPGIQ